jgi:hypothetical protein
MFKEDEITVGSKWVSVGTKIPVEVIKVEDGWIEYRYFDGKIHEKDVFCFQCRYCLVVEDLEAFSIKYVGQFEVVDTLD